MMRTTMSRLPERQPRSTATAAMAVRFLSCQLTDDGLAALAEEVERRLVDDSTSLDLATCKDIIDRNPSWLAGPSRPQLPGHFTTTLANRRARA